MKRCDIVLIKFPFTDLSSNKVRPALVVSSDNYNQQGQDAIFMLITSNTSNPTSSDILIDSSDEEFSLTGLKRASLIKTGKIVILLKNLATRKLGEAGPVLMTKVNNMLSEVLGLQDVVASQLQIDDSNKQESAASNTAEGPAT